MPQVAAIFDMDGLMLDTERMARVAWRRALAELGYPISEEQYLNMVGRTVRDAETYLHGVFGPDLPFDEVFRLRQAYYDQDIEQNGIPVKPGITALLEYLEEKNITRAVASSTPCWFAGIKLAKVGLSQRFEVIVCGDMVERGKPAPDLFLEAARRIDYAPEHCIVFEDSEAGIRAAHAAGMIPVMVPDLKQPAPEVRSLAYRVLPSLCDAIPVVERILADGKAA